MSNLDFDSSWCPVCDRQILPKRYLVDIPPAAPAAAPVQPPSSPSSSSSPVKRTTSTGATRPPAVRRTKTRTAGGGLVAGTGRVKPNGALKQPPPPAPAPPTVTAATAKPRQRTVIDQSPLPLYCSDECRLADMGVGVGLQGLYDPAAHDFTQRQLEHGYGATDPAQRSPTLPPVPNNSFSAADSSESEASLTSSSPASSSRSLSQMPDSVSPRTRPVQPGFENASPSLAALAAMYNFPPLPPPPPRAPTPPPPRKADDYSSGIMMAAERIRAALAPAAPPKRNGMFAPLHDDGAKKERQVVPGWTDGSSAWRAEVYSLAPPSTSGSSKRDEAHRQLAYGGFVASPHRSHGVYSTLGDEAKVPQPQRQPIQRTASAEYSLTFSRQPSTASLPSLSSSSASACTSTSTSTSRRRRNLVPPDVLAMLAVPASMAAMAHSSPNPPQSARENRAAKKEAIRRLGSEASELGSVAEEPVPSARTPRRGNSLDVPASTTLRGHSTSPPRAPSSAFNHASNTPTASASSSKLSASPGKTATIRPPRARPASVRAWSYDNVQTYPAMQPRREIERVKRRVVGDDGVEREEIVEVEVPPKRLFLFGGV
ncbi:hypothetical protein PLICRDRAFT_173956 [Plicaturopsis crispa FD-325 SS-3]|nr:hypothetical protein PLICRDRAFT_173956 [Plicaturopsis crispa FD-325 SS-3]